MSIAPYIIESAPPTEARREDDRTLAIALLGGAPGAAERAWKRFSPIVLRILRRCLGPGPEQQDLLQEVFIRVFKRIDDLRDRNALRAFVVNISLGVAQNELRSRRVRQRLCLTRTGELPVRPVAAADFAAREALVRCFRLLDRVGDGDRALFVLRYVEKNEIGEIAAAFAWSLTKTKRRLRRATARIARLMERDPALAHYASHLCTERNHQDQGDER